MIFKKQLVWCLLKNVELCWNVVYGSVWPPFIHAVGGRLWWHIAEAWCLLGDFASVTSVCTSLRGKVEIWSWLECLLCPLSLVIFASFQVIWSIGVDVIEIFKLSSFRNVSKEELIAAPLVADHKSTVSWGVSLLLSSSCLGSRDHLHWCTVLLLHFSLLK